MWVEIQNLLDIIVQSVKRALDAGGMPVEHE